MPRLLFEKKGNAVWISHLDLMRLFQRRPLCLRHLLEKPNLRRKKYRFGYGWL